MKSAGGPSLPLPKNAGAPEPVLSLPKDLALETCETAPPQPCKTESVPRTMPALTLDLDGTLTGSVPGIVGCLRKVLDTRNRGDREIRVSFIAETLPASQTIQGRPRHEGGERYRADHVQYGEPE